MHRFSLADDLAEVREEITRLRQREAMLRAAILAAPEALLTGRWSRVEVDRTRHTVFDPGLLPAALRDDPSFQREKTVTVLRCLPLPHPPARPGWPIRREAAGLH